ncbi:helix-turn-helix domain-containing protein [Extensimonas sp. H3M7-6]|uniref:helix-turn-helix domain-containing protein n=1 Tax=Extensimonas soli TaxID=3031322 RepID=UPI0023DABCB5|nr:helix-turn-helix domain-containing protein [Extensimonas sp. H3M7-6]MDF1482747.1 helix-turn-helix domain-containing protein [Extensimonas sp. H3M7-6]
MSVTALPPPTDRHTLVAQARQALRAGTAAEAARATAMPPAPAGLEPWIARSWQRCLSSGLQPTQRVVFDAVSAAALRRTHEQHHSLLQAARPVLEQLARTITGMRYFALLTDAHGIVLAVQGLHGLPADGDPRARAIARVGINLSEAAVGTTAIGAALTELQAVWLHRGEHFFEDNTCYSCAGAPLFDPWGRCMGMLDLTGVDVPERPELRHLAVRSARAIEDALLLQQPHALLLRVNWPGSPLGAGGGLLVLGADGQVLGSNGMARQLMPLPQLPPGTALHWSHLCALPWGLLLGAAQQAARHGPAPLELPLWSGLRLHGLALLAAPQRTLVAVAEVAEVAAAPGTPGTPGASVETAAAVPTPLRETETALIRQAVRAARGNVAQAARALGISRATVYRKLGNLKKP